MITDFERAAINSLLRSSPSTIHKGPRPGPVLCVQGQRTGTGACTGPVLCCQGRRNEELVNQKVCRRRLGRYQGRVQQCLPKKVRRRSVFGERHKEEPAQEQQATMEPIREEPAVQEPAREQAPEDAQRDMDRILEELRWLEERRQQYRNWMELFASRRSVQVSTPSRKASEGFLGRSAFSRAAW